MQSTRDALDESDGSSALRDRMSDILKTVTMLEDFTLIIIRRGTRGKAVGMSGLTYQLMKVWPDKIIKNVYNLMVMQWNSNSLPEFMKWRWLCPIHKRTWDIRIEDLRPLSLVDFLRKLWSSHVIQKMRGLWEKKAT